VGNLFRIKDPDSVRIGNYFMKGRLKSRDLVLCVEHSGDCFQNYIFIAEYANSLRGKPEYSFGSYGIGDSEKVDDYQLDDIARATLIEGKHPVWIEEEKEEPEVIVTIKRKIS
jgi:hypothetical protein